MIKKRVITAKIKKKNDIMKMMIIRTRIVIGVLNRTPSFGMNKY